MTIREGESCLATLGNGGGIGEAFTTMGVQRYMTGGGATEETFIWASEEITLEIFFSPRFTP